MTSTSATPLSLPQLAVIQSPQRGNPATLPAATPRQAVTRLPAAPPAASQRGRIVDIVV